MCSTTTTTTAGASDHGGGTPINAIHPDIIQSHILNRLDGQTLASTSCTSAQLLSICSEDRLWKQICNSTWPSTTHPIVRDAIAAFPSGHRSFYSDSFPSVRCHSPGDRSKTAHQTRASERKSQFISAADIFYDDELLYSKVLVSETLSRWFLSSPFRLDLIERKERVPMPLKFDGEDGEDGACMELAKERLRISWILIDPSKKRAVNIASLKPVDARRHWLTEDIELRYSTVVAGGDGKLVQCAVLVNCGGKEGGDLQVREVSMQVEDMEGKILTGYDSLRALDMAMEGQRCKSDTAMDKDIYEMFLKMKIKYRERKQERERSLDMLFIAAGVSIYLAIWIYFLSR